MENMFFTKRQEKEQEHHRIINSWIYFHIVSLHQKTWIHGSPGEIAKSNPCLIIESFLKHCFHLLGDKSSTSIIGSRIPRYPPNSRASWICLVKNALKNLSKYSPRWCFKKGRGSSAHALRGSSAHAPCPGVICTRTAWYKGGVGGGGGWGLIQGRGGWWGWVGVIQGRGGWWGWVWADTREGWVVGVGGGDTREGWVVGVGGGDTREGWVVGVKFLHIERKITSVVHSHPPSHYIRKHASGWRHVMFTTRRTQNN